MNKFLKKIIEFHFYVNAEFKEYSFKLIKEIIKLLLNLIFDNSLNDFINKSIFNSDKLMNFIINPNSVLYSEIYKNAQLYYKIMLEDFTYKDFKKYYNEFVLEIPNFIIDIQNEIKKEKKFNINKFKESEETKKKNKIKEKTIRMKDCIKKYIFIYSEVDNLKNSSLTKFNNIIRKINMWAKKDLPLEDLIKNNKMTLNQINELNELIENENEPDIKNSILMTIDCLKEIENKLNLIKDYNNYQFLLNSIKNIEKLNNLKETKEFIKKLSNNKFITNIELQNNIDKQINFIENKIKEGYDKIYKNNTNSESLNKVKILKNELNNYKNNLDKINKLIQNENNINELESKRKNFEENIKDNNNKIEYLEYLEVFENRELKNQINNAFAYIKEKIQMFYNELKEQDKHFLGNSKIMSKPFIIFTDCAKIPHLFFVESNKFFELCKKLNNQKKELLNLITKESSYKYLFSEEKIKVIEISFSYPQILSKKYIKRQCIFYDKYNNLTKINPVSSEDIFYINPDIYTNDKDKFLIGYVNKDNSFENSIKNYKLDFQFFNKINEENIEELIDLNLQDIKSYDYTKDLPCLQFGKKEKISEDKFYDILNEYSVSTTKLLEMFEIFDKDLKDNSLNGIKSSIFKIKQLMIDL